MIINILGGLIFIAASFIVRHFAEQSTATTIFTWSLFGVGLMIILFFLFSLLNQEKLE